MHHSGLWTAHNPVFPPHVQNMLSDNIQMARWPNFAQGKIKSKKKWGQAMLTPLVMASVASHTPIWQGKRALISWHEAPTLLPLSTPFITAALTAWGAQQRKYSWGPNCSSSVCLFCSQPSKEELQAKWTTIFRAGKKKRKRSWQKAKSQSRLPDAQW